MKDLLKRLIKRMTRGRFVILERKNLTYAKDLLYTTNNAEFLKDKEFVDAYRWVKQLDKTGITGEGIEWRIHVLCWAAHHASQLEGDFVDCGVNTGLFSRAVIEYVGFDNLSKTYYLFDTFTGMDPRYSSEYEISRHHKIGYEDNDDVYEQVKQTFREYKVEIIKGAIPETLHDAEISKVAYLSVDMNCVLPEVAALEHFWEKMVSGGIIVLDDYGYPGCQEQKSAHDKFAKDRGVSVLALPTCQGLIIKP